MGTIDGMLMEIDDNIKNANIVKESVLNRLQLDGLISETQASDYTEKWQVIIVKKSWFRSWADKHTKGDKNGYYFKFVKFEE